MPCTCGDRVVADTVLTADIGPCSWADAMPPDELVGLRVDSNVTLDCNGFSVLGPADAQKEEFGIKVGSSTRPVQNATVRNCTVTGFWWGIYVTDSDGVLVEDNVAIANGWKSETENGTGYGIDVAQSTNVLVRNNQIVDNGNEGFHLSSSTGVTVEGNTFRHNGWEQLYLIGADANTILANDAEGGRQGLEMRDSSLNQFSGNAWRASPKQWLENDNDQNTFVYDAFEGVLEVSSSSNGNRFEVCSLWNPGDECTQVRSGNNTFFKSHFTCRRDVDTADPLTLDRVVSANKTKRRSEITVILDGCTADMDLDGDVEADDQAVVAAALGSTPGAPGWNPEADLDHDGDVDQVDVAAAAAQAGACDFRNRSPIAGARRIVLVNNPNGQPDTIRIDAARSRDDHDAIIRYEFYAENAFTGEALFRQTLAGVPPEQAYVDYDYPPGKYNVYVYVTDNFGVVSNPKRRIVTVR